MTGPLLGVWAHPDDEAYLSAGLMARARQAGRRVVVVTMTAGERGTDDPDSWPPRRLAAVRRHELTASLAALGVRELQLVGLPDGGCDGHDASTLLAGVITELKPATIVTFGPDGMTGHPDHRAVSSWTTAAWAASGCRGDLWYATVTQQFHRRWGEVNGRIGLWADQPAPPCSADAELASSIELDDHELDRKLVALRAHASQTSGLIAALGEEMFRRWWATEAFVPARRDAPVPAVAGSLRCRDEVGRSVT